MTNIVGSGVEAYARLFHPLAEEPGGPTWAEVARANGRVMHPSVQWDKIRGRGPFNPNDPRLQGRNRPGNSHWGELNTWALEALCAVLTVHTTTPQTCYFAVWEGCGALGEPLPGSFITSYRGPGPKPAPPGPAPADWQLDLRGPRFRLPGRHGYYLFEGHVGEAVRIGRWVHETCFRPKSPHFFWPADHAWCVGTEVDDDSTFIGGSRELVDELCASDVLEVLPIAPDAPYEDDVNV
ncbi:hypothetical protein [Mycobacterium attenuatum]|uniref:hypothetical protein n=1 Tax=Mycobacterium attenuatum TaxID=2341086 RepID=UPI0010A973ED|nr:hypothetical protein [Mycobacterium attenuatum]